MSLKGSAPLVPGTGRRALPEVSPKYHDRAGGTSATKIETVARDVATEVVNAAAFGQLLSATGTVTIPAGGGDILPQLTTLLEQVGFDATTLGGSWTIPADATYVIEIDIRYTDGYRGGGTVEVTLDGV